MRMLRSSYLPRLLVVGAMALLGVLTFAPRTLADNAVTGTLGPSPNTSTPTFQLWSFIGPSDGSTVTLTLTYSPNGSGVDPATQKTYDNLIGFNVYGDDGSLFGQSTLVGAGHRTWSFVSTTSVHQYTAQVFNYVESSGATYTLTAQNTTLAAAVTPTATANPFAPQPTPTIPATPTPLPVSGNPGGTVAPVGSLSAAGSSVQGQLTGTLLNATRDYTVPGTVDGSSINLLLSGSPANLLSTTLACVNVYQLQGGVKVLIAVGLPPLSNPNVCAVSFPGGEGGYGPFIAEVYNGDPGVTLSYTLTRQ
jgi:hypothetical protein